MHKQVLLPFFFFNDTATTEIYTLSLHDALPIFRYLIGASPGGAEGVTALLRVFCRPIRGLIRMETPIPGLTPGANNLLRLRRFEWLEISSKCTSRIRVH